MAAKIFYFSNLTEKDLLALIRRDDRQAFSVLYEKYWESLFNAAYKRLADTPACEEIIQDLFVHLYEVRKEIDIGISLSGYLQTALKHRILNYLRSRERRIAHTLQAARMNLPVENSTVDTVELNALNRAVEGSLRKMPRKYREVYELNRQHQMPVREAAQRLGISGNRAEKYLRKAIAILRSDLGEFLPVLLVFLLGGKK